MLSFIVVTSFWKRAASPRSAFKCSVHKRYLVPKIQNKIKLNRNPIRGKPNLNTTGVRCVLNQMMLSNSLRKSNAEISELESEILTLKIEGKKLLILSEIKPVFFFWEYWRQHHFDTAQPKWPWKRWSLLSSGLTSTMWQQTLGSEHAFSGVNFDNVKGDLISNKPYLNIYYLPPFCLVKQPTMTLCLIWQHHTLSPEYECICT